MPWPMSAKPFLICGICTVGLVQSRIAASLTVGPAEDPAPARYLVHCAASCWQYALSLWASAIAPETMQQASRNAVLPEIALIVPIVSFSSTRAIVSVVPRHPVTLDYSKRKEQLRRPQRGPLYVSTDPLGL